MYPKVLKKNFGLVTDWISSENDDDLSDTDDEGVVVPFFPPIGNLLGGGRERTAPIPLGGGAEDVIGREIQTPLVSEQNGPSHTEEGM